MCAGGLEIVAKGEADELLMRLLLIKESAGKRCLFFALAYYCSEVAQHCGWYQQFTWNTFFFP